MTKRYLCSDRTTDEAYLLQTGRMFIGEGNVLTGVIKIIGMHDDLQKSNRESEITSYDPDSDLSFKRENNGYTVLRKTLANTDTPVSRRFIKSLSRKWKPGHVRISFDTIHIITVMLEYISARAALHTACSAYLKNYNLKTDWNKLMPIQYDFLGIRYRDRHNDWEIAGKIISDLSESF